MSLTFEINKLGTIRNCQIKFKPLLIFSGPSNVGKSYSAFLVYFVIKHISEIELMSFIENNFSLELKKLKSKKDTNIVIEPQIFNKWLNDNVSQYLKYLLNSENINYSGNIIAEFDKIDLFFTIYEESASNRKTNILAVKNLDKQYYLQSTESIPLIVYEIISNELSKRILGTDSKQTLLLPPSKSALVNFTQTIDDQVGLGMYKEFLKDYKIIKETNKAAIKGNVIPKVLRENINSFMEDILNGNISEINKELYFSFSDTMIPISAAASSIKELAPFLIAINKYPPSLLSILFEEPESHLHPHLQIELAKLIALLHNFNCFFQITTHSDLFISQLNNLIRLNNLKNKNKSLYIEYLNKFHLSPQHAVSTDKVGAYLFKKNEKGFTNIIQQNIDNGISLDSFDNAIENLYAQTSFLDNQLELS